MWFWYHIYHYVSPIHVTPPPTPPALLLCSTTWSSVPIQYFGPRSTESVLFPQWTWTAQKSSTLLDNSAHSLNCNRCTGLLISVSDYPCMICKTVVIIPICLAICGLRWLDKQVCQSHPLTHMTYSSILMLISGHKLTWTVAKQQNVSKAKTTYRYVIMVIWQSWL